MIEDRLIAQLRRHCLKVTNGDLAGYCGAVSLMIQGCFGGDVMEGIVPWNGDRCPHYWNRLPSGREIECFSDSRGRYCRQCEWKIIDNWVVCAQVLQRASIAHAATYVVPERPGPRHADGIGRHPPALGPLPLDSFWHHEIFPDQISSSPRCAR
jgi:hypothetical protein